MQKLLLLFWVMLFLLATAGCSQRTAPPEYSQPENPEYLSLELPPGSEVTLTCVGGEVMTLSRDVSLNSLLATLEKAVYKSDHLPEKDAAEEGKTFLTFSYPNGELRVFLYSNYVYVFDQFYSLNPNNIEALYAFFEATPRKPVEIEGLVLVSDLDDSIILDLRYATPDNFTGQVIYPVAVAAINKETGERLLRAHEIFKADGYTIKLWDAYRPLSAQQKLWEAFPDPLYVHKPQDPQPTSGFRPRHNNGMCVDITLVDQNGQELKMPTAFDDFTEKADPNYPHMTPKVRYNVDYLISVMESVGFKVAHAEWWHFSDITSTPGPYLDIPLEAFLEP